MLRAFVTNKVPFLVTSTILPALVLAQVCTTVHMQADTSYHIKLGTNQPNIAWFVRWMTGAKKDFESLTFFIPNATEDECYTFSYCFTFIITHPAPAI